MEYRTIALLLGLGRSTYVQLYLIHAMQLKNGYFVMFQFLMVIVCALSLMDLMYTGDFLKQQGQLIELISLEVFFYIHIYLGWCGKVHNPGVFVNSSFFAKA